MKHLGVIVFGSMTTLATVGVVWLVYSNPFWLIVSPVFAVVFIGPLGLLFLIFLFRRRRN